VVFLVYLGKEESVSIEVSLEEEGRGGERGYDREGRGGVG
jgi:hypothetical protein